MKIRQIVDFLYTIPLILITVLTLLAGLALIIYANYMILFSDIEIVGKAIYFVLANLIVFPFLLATILSLFDKKELKIKEVFR